ncbi:MAG TPA: hypothetical protein ENL21_02455 [Caldithrix abyssi]|uniref:Uncharacterized protein n=1 Tax=Caldithrix abyssi TaxID=187145 RepID=A0A7V5H2M1_CALAY|nr:hypothetical protein [Caldithrix abyssi]
MFFRLLLMILADVLFAAHILRFNGIVPALLIILFAFTLLIRRPVIPKIWQILLLLSIGEWIRVTSMFVRYRLVMDMPYVRLLIIMALVILFFVFVIFWWNNQKIQEFYHLIPEKGGDQN